VEAARTRTGRRSLALVALPVLLLAIVAATARAAAADPADGDDEGDAPEQVVGERLFQEPRFAQWFAAHAGDDANAPFGAGDPTVATLATPDGAIPGPFAGQAMSCRQCHLVDDALPIPGGGSRAYGDFARRSPIPPRPDGRTTAPRNSPALVGASVARQRGTPFVLHFDGEFPSTAALARGTLIGRNYGWLPSEQAQAIAHVAAVIRGDDGSGALARDAGGPYRRVLAGTDPTLPADVRLPKRFRLDVDRATDDQVLDAVARLIGAYVDGLAFAADDAGFSGSPYDRFLDENRLPRRPVSGEPTGVYVQRLRLLLAQLDAPALVEDGVDGTFRLHPQPFRFGATELEGLRVFLDPRGGNCVACHPPPAFTDFRAHDTGVTQLDYDRAHGDGAFRALAVPSATARRASPDAWLPASPRHPGAAEPFRALVAADAPGRTDLGLWNLLDNPDHDDPRLQRRLRRLVCATLGPDSRCRRLAPTRDALLERAIALFKTPTLRDLDHTGPYFHTGGVDTLDAVVAQYRQAAELQRAGLLRNGDRRLARIHLDDADAAALVAFLHALDEDYD
jgi:cytochrome c peroxidase